MILKFSEWIRINEDQTTVQSTGRSTGQTAKQDTTLNLYLDKENKKPYATGKITSTWPPAKLDKNGEIEFILKTQTAGDLLLKWSQNKRNQFLNISATNGSVKGTYYNQNLSDFLAKKFPTPVKNNPSATFAQSTSGETDSNTNLA
jgi:hypothetical protein